VSTADRSQIVRLQLLLKQREHELSQQRELNRLQRETIARLEQRVCDLEMRVRTDSSTSSAPPSSDKPWDKPARRKARNKRKKDKQNKFDDDTGFKYKLKKVHFSISKVAYAWLLVKPSYLLASITKPALMFF